MPKKTILIENIWNGAAFAENFLAQGQYLNAVGIDPEIPTSDATGDQKPSGLIRPTAYSDFSGANVTGIPKFIATNPINSLVYAYLSNGRLISYSSSLGSETLVGTASSSSGNGFAYYNNYLYLATNTDISRYGPLDGSPSLTDSVWTGSTLGTQTALVNTSYPSLRGSVGMPNHVMHVHGDNALYVCDFINTGTSSTRGQGVIHRIKTKTTTNQGDTNDGTLAQVLDLPLGFMPVALASFSTDLVIAAVETTNGTISQGNASLFFWDTFSDSFHTEVKLEDPLVTALQNVNGQLYIYSGPISTGSNVSNGYRVSIYAGGESVQEIYNSPIGQPPFVGAVTSIGNQLLWGTFNLLRTASSPNYYAVVMSLGARNKALPSGVHCIANTTATGSASDGIVTALANVEQSNMLSNPKLIIGHNDASGSGIDKKSTTYGTSVWQYPVNIGRKFRIVRIRMPLANAVASNMTITPTVYIDNFTSSSTAGLRVINSTNYPNSEEHVVYYPDINGDKNFVFELAWSGTVLQLPHFPIEIEVEVYRD